MFHAMVNYPLILAPCSKIRGIIQKIAATLKLLLGCLAAFQDRTAGRDHNRFHGHRGFGSLHALFYDHGQPRTTRHFHDDDGDAPDAGHFKYLGKLVNIFIDLIELGAAHHDGFAFEKILVQ